MASLPKRIAVVSHVRHYEHNARLYAYGPYAREIDIWAELFEEVVIAAPCCSDDPPGDCVPFERANIRIVSQRDTGGVRWTKKLRQVILLPFMVADLCRVLRRAEAIHVRCPGNLGLLGAILAPFFTRYMVAKYAGQWGAYPGEPLSVKFQRALLNSQYWRGPVTIYGRYPKQPRHVVSFFTSVMTAEQVARARVAAVTGRSHRPLRVIYVGRLSKAKNVDSVLRSIANLRTARHELDCQIVGEGPERDRLEALCLELGIRDRVKFTGGLHFDAVLDIYQRSDVLVLCSETEGWPKTIAEGMAFGLVCIGSNRGLVPEMLGEKRGVVIEPGDTQGLTEALADIAARPDYYKGVRARAAEWGQRYSVEHLRLGLHELLVQFWRLGESVQTKRAPQVEA